MERLSILTRSAKKQEDARVDIKTVGIWRRQQSAFFDVRLFHPNVPSYRDKSVAALFRKHELDKKREYGDRIREVENGSITPLVFSTTGGASRETTVVFKRVAELLANKRNSPYSITLAWMRCHVSFALMKSTISCIRGSRSPSIITGDTYRPDLLLSTSNGMLYIVELTVGFESSLQKNAERKKSKYKELIREQKEHFNAVKFVNLSISSLGVFAKEYSSFIEMLNDLDFQKHHQNYCIRKMTMIAIRTTYYIFCCRNKEWTIPELLTV